MHVIAHHRIQDPDGFRRWAEEPVTGRPPALAADPIRAGPGGLTAFCLWWADSTEDLRHFLERSLGDVSEVECHAIDEENAMGLWRPVVTLIRLPHGVRPDGRTKVLLDRHPIP